ncbi:hypothetical protein C8R44DRAFT_743136 [Mycena epipterygia]|nr:hypothetical protein C8R44DRAFT_743136 [Mycena epipterygia]
MGAFLLQGVPIRLLPRGPSLWTRHFHTIGIQERKRRGPRGHILSTLDPELLKCEDVLDLSQKKNISIRFPGSEGSGMRLRYHARKLPFPPDSRGFLYYHSGTPAAPLDGSLRFRLTSDNIPLSFPHGRDLLAPWGLPWQITLAQIACIADYGVIRDQLIHDDLATAGQLSRCRSIFHETSKTFARYTLFHLGSTFLVNFSAALCFTTVGDTLYKVKLYPFRERVRNTSKKCFPWSGSAVARFEPSTLAEHTGRRVVHLRIVKIIQPVAPTIEGHKGRLVKPEAGQLLVASFRDGDPEPWAYDIDRKTEPALALRVLWDKLGLP